MIDSGTMIAVAKASLVQESCRAYVGKTRMQGAFGECVDADLVILKVRLKPDIFNCTNAINTESTVMSIPIVFALTDALASKHFDMLLPMHAVMELHRYQNLCVVCPEQSATGENMLNVMAADDTVNSTTDDAPVDVENNVCNNKVMLMIMCLLTMTVQTVTMI